MDLKNKLFKNNKTGELIKVIDTFENIAILESKEKIDVRRLTNSDFFTEQIDPKNFFSNQNAYNSLAEKIKNIPLNQIKDDDGPVQQISVGSPANSLMPATTESAIVMSSEEDERAELARKYGVNPIPVNSLQKQNEAFAKLLGEESADELPQIPQQQQIPLVDEAAVQRIQVERDTIQQQATNVFVVDDPIITMFKKTKRGVNFSISFDVNDKIPRIDFIEMMEDSYEISMIDFLAEEFTNKLLSDRNIIKNKIKDKINEVVYGKKKSANNDQITDSVTQKNESTSTEKEPILSKDLPKKTSRNSKPTKSKKESIEK